VRIATVCCAAGCALTRVCSARLEAVCATSNARRCRRAAGIPAEAQPAPGAASVRSRASRCFWCCTHSLLPPQSQGGAHRARRAARRAGRRAACAAARGAASRRSRRRGMVRSAAVLLVCQKRC
jgi:hypothetical protein